MTENKGCIKLPVNRLHMELTNICNFSCEFCPDSKMKREKGIMSLEFARAILDEVARTKAAKTVHFHVMGEPTLHPHLVEIAAYAGSLRIETCLTTNGSRLDSKLLGELARAGVGKIIISLQTPDERTFALRGSKGLTFDEYAEGILGIARQFLSGRGNPTLTISFLSSPLRRLIIPIYPEVSIADTSADLRKHLNVWAEKIVKGATIEGGKAGRDDIARQIRKISSFRENVIRLTQRLDFHTRIMGDWSVHFDRDNVNAYFGYCPGIQENLGILWNGDYTFCCTDFDGRTSTMNFKDVPLTEFLATEEVQRVARGFNRFRVLHPYCKQCLGDRNILNAVVKQIGSICYFKFWRNT